MREIILVTDRVLDFATGVEEKRWWMGPLIECPPCMDFLRFAKGHPESYIVKTYREPRTGGWYHHTYVLVGIRAKMLACLRPGLGGDHHSWVASPAAVFRPHCARYAEFYREDLATIGLEDVDRCYVASGAEGHTPEELLAESKSLYTMMMMSDGIER